jgi:hypothetical protein
VTDWTPGDPVYPVPAPWTRQSTHPSAAPGHRDGGYCWCDGPTWVPFHGAARFTPEFPVPRFSPER